MFRSHAVGAEPADSGSEGGLRRSAESLNRHRARLERIEAGLAGAGEKHDAARLHAARANELLAHGAPVALTRLFLGIGRPEDHKELQVTVEEAADHLERAATLVKEVLSSADTVSSDAVRAEAEDLQKQIEELRRFAAAMKTLGDLEKADKEEKPEAVQAARGLAVARESDDPEIASAARVWQSLAWAAAGRADRALRALPAITDTPQRWPWDVFAAMLRCRLLQHENRAAVAVALAIQLERRVPSWRAAPASEEAIAQTVSLLQEAMLDRWRAMEDESAPSARDNIEAIRKTVAAKRGAEEAGSAGPSIYLFEPAAPQLIAPPEARNQATAPATQSASGAGPSGLRPITSTAPADTQPSADNAESPAR